MSATVLRALDAELARDGARPLVTFYDGATGERIELSVRTFDNWVCKVANLLGDELMLEAGGAIAVDLPAHWQSAVVVAGAWAAGLRVIEDADAADVLVVGPHRERDPAPGVAVLAVSLRPLGGPFTEIHDDGGCGPSAGRTHRAISPDGADSTPHCRTGGFPAPGQQ